MDLNIIKSNPAFKKHNLIIYGLDADLIMLALSTGLDNIYLLREKQVFELKKNIDTKQRVQVKIQQQTTGNTRQQWVQKDVRTFDAPQEDKEDKMDTEFNLLPIRKLKEFYWNDINKDYKYSQHITKEQFMTDFIFICFFIGNDFLPHHKIINVHKSGIDMMIEEYLKQVKLTNTTLLTVLSSLQRTLSVIILTTYIRSPQIH